MMTPDRVTLWQEKFKKTSSITDRWRVGIYANGKMFCYNIYDIEEVADRWANQMREAYRKANAHAIFIKKEKIL